VHKARRDRVFSWKGVLPLVRKKLGKRLVGGCQKKQRCEKGEGIDAIGGKLPARREGKGVPLMLLGEVMKPLG